MGEVSNVEVLSIIEPYNFPCCSQPSCSNKKANLEKHSGRIYSGTVKQALKHIQRPPGPSGRPSESFNFEQTLQHAPRRVTAITDFNDFG